MSKANVQHLFSFVLKQSVIIKKNLLKFSVYGRGLHLKAMTKAQGQEQRHALETEDKTKAKDTAPCHRGAPRMRTSPQRHITE